MKYLYKYREINSNTEKIFTERKVWLSNASGLNDPFECSIQDIAEDYIKLKVKDMKRGQIEGFIMNSIMNLKSNSALDGRTKRNIKKVLQKIKSENNFNKKYKLVKDLIKMRTGTHLVNPINTFRNFDKQLQDAGIFSLSEDSLNELMWSHYANNSKGIVIGFEISENSKLANIDKCLQVNYSDELPKFESNGFMTETTVSFGGQNTQKIAFHDPTLKLAISTKSKNWSYEREWRYVEPKQGLYPFPGTISRLIFGLKTERDDIKKYIELSRKFISNKVDYFKVEIIKNTNKLEIVKLKGSD